MRTFWKWALVLAVPAACMAAAQSQGERLVPEGTTVQLLLLRPQSVRQVLNLTPAEREKIFEFTYKQQEAAEKALKLGAAERRQKFKQLHKENEEFLEKTFKPEQRKRLDQITMQVAGLVWLARPAMARELKLTKDQIEKAKQFHEEARKELIEVIHAKSREGRSEKLAELRKTTRQRVMGLLTAEQKAKWRELAGPPFKGKLEFEEPEAGSK
jgi:Spy/CpxP family protein refolding chaperone